MYTNIPDPSYLTRRGSEPKPVQVTSQSQHACGPVTIMS